MARRPTATGILLTLMVVVGSACNGGDDDTNGNGDGGEIPVEETTTDPRSRGGASGPAACDDEGGSPEPPADAVAIEQEGGDFDGNGGPDRVIVYGLGTTADPAPWHVRIVLDNDFVADREIEAQAGVSVTPLGSTQLERSDVAFVRVGEDAETFSVDLFALVDCEVVRLAPEAPGATTPPFPIGGTDVRGDGLECSDVDDDGVAELVALSVETTDDPAEVETTRTPYEVRDGRLIAGETVRRARDAARVDTPAFYTVTCAGVSVAS